MKRLITSILIAAPLVAAQAQTAPAPKPAAPATVGSIFDKAVNKPGIGWEVYGANQSAKQVAAADVPGGGAVRVQVTRAGEHAWDVGAGYPSVKGIAAGDTILVMVFLRAPDAKTGAGVPLPISAGESDAPYTTITNENVQVGPAWKRYYASGIAAKSLPAGKARISLQLGGAKQVIEMGPAFLLDLGPGVALSKLPHN